MTSDASSTGGKVLEELIARLEQADNLDEAFFQEIVERSADRDPALPELLPAAAIPRALDAEIVGVLRGAPDDAEANARLLDVLSTYRFVNRRPDGRFVYHDNTRDAALAEWRSSDDKRETFDALNQALAEHYAAQYDNAAEDERRVDRVAGLIAAANPGRLRRLARVTESGMTEALLEALYHHLLISPENGVAFFKQTFYVLEDANRLSICHSLIVAVRDFLERLPPGEEEPVLLAWCDYFAARILRDLEGGDVAAAEQSLRALLENDALPSDLRIWALGDLAIVYESQLKMGQALATRIELTEQDTGDVYNDPLRRNALANLYSWLSDLPAALEQFELAIEQVDRLPGARQDIGVSARVDLSAVRADLRDWSGAFETALEALQLVRTTFRDDRLLGQQVAVRLGQLLSTFDASASDSAFAEAIALGDARHHQHAFAALTYLDVLLEVGRLQRARATCAMLAADAAVARSEDDGHVPWLVDFELRRGLLLHREGREDEANERYGKVIEATEDVPDAQHTNLAARLCRGISLASQASLSEAEQDLAAARDGYRAAGSKVQAAAATVQLADALARRRDVDTARALLDEAEKALPCESSDRAAADLVRGHIAARTADWVGAEASYERALRDAAQRRDLPRQGSLLHKLADVSAEYANWQHAADYSQRAANIDQKLAALDQADDSKRTEADRLNAEGMRSFNEIGGGAAALDEAREFLTSAAGADTTSFWPTLNLSFVLAEQRDWAGAADALTRVLDLCPEPMRVVALHRALRDHVIEHAREIRGRGDPARAAAAAGAALDRLSTGLGSAELAPFEAFHAALIAVSGAHDDAVACIRAATPTEEGEDPSPEQLAETMAFAIESPADYWAVDDVLAAVEHDAEARSAVASLAGATRAALTPRLEELLGLAPTNIESQYSPIIIPIVGEVGDELVPFVDPRSDGGMFLDELVPEMRERIRTSTGVVVPGLRMRGSFTLRPREFSLQIDEVPIFTETAAEASAVVAADDRPPAAQLGPALTDRHPLTGELGLWVVEPAAEEPSGAATVLTVAHYLIHRLDAGIRANLVPLLGVDQVAALVDEWGEADEDGLVETVVPDQLSRLRLTWVLQLVVADGVPIADWRAVLAAIRDAGGLSAPAQALRRGVRARLRAELPARVGRRPVRVPAELEAALLGAGTADDGAEVGAQDRNDFLRWLRSTVWQDGAGIVLVASADAARERVARLVSTEDPTLPTLTEDELA